MLAAIGYSFMYLLGGGGIFGAIVIFFIAKMFRKKASRLSFNKMTQAIGPHWHLRASILLNLNPPDSPKAIPACSGMATM
jgi:hypothetical protein